MDTPYNPTNIRALLNEGFTDSDLRNLCFDKFRVVHNQLATSSGKDEIVSKLLEYCDRTAQIEALLTWAERHNPARYEMHQPYFETVTSPAKSPSENSGSADSRAVIAPSMEAEPASFQIDSKNPSPHSPEPQLVPTKLPQTPSPQPIQPEPLPKKSVDYWRDPIWQMIGVVVAVISVLIAIIGVAWPIYTFYVPGTILVTPTSIPTPFTPTSITQADFTPTSVPTHTPILTSKPEPTSTLPSPLATDSPNTDAVAAATAMTPVVGYPCKAEIISSTGSNIVNTVRENASGTASIVVNKPLTVKTIVLIYDKRIEKDGVWYEIWIDSRNKVGYLPPENLLLYESCPK